MLCIFLAGVRERRRKMANDEGESVNDILGRFPASDVPRSSGSTGTIS